MCQDCGCHQQQDNNIKKIIIDKSLTKDNDTIASDISQTLKKQNILSINLLGAPGSGKTSFIEGLATHLDPKKILVIQGDLESDIDKIRLQKQGIDTYQINTHSGCHLNATMIKTALKSITKKDMLKGKHYLFIENVGNLVCPAGIKIGQHINIIVSSTTEGSDKPKKYPHIFLDVKLAIISKFDLASSVEFDKEIYSKDIISINPKIKIIQTSSKDPDSFSKPSSYILHQRDHLLGLSHNH